jgi:tRNA-Thr(GGU) m(6)t(6)A37 methyltransferase TsaA
MGKETVLAAGLCVGGLAVSAWLWVANRNLQKELARMTELRQAERQGRIRAEQAVTKSACESSLTVFPIGTVRSVFAKRSGTPRQPGLVASVESRIEIDPTLKQAIDSIGEFSHVWVMFIFHKNTNMSKMLKAKKPFQGLKLLVEPPKAGGKKVGVLSCRTPHRPNPIGLSLCRVVKVERDAIVVAGLDCLDGSPVIDIKPYLPMIENVPEAIVPDWIYQGVDEDRAVVVEWACERKIPNSGKGGDEDEKTLKVIEEVLSRDIRSTHQIELGNQMQDDWTGEVRVGELTIVYALGKDKIVQIKEIVKS